MSERRQLRTNWKWVIGILLPILVPLLLLLGAYESRVSTLESDHQSHEESLENYIERPEFNQFEKRMEGQHKGISDNIDLLREDLRLARRARRKRLNNEDEGSN